MSKANQIQIGLLGVIVLLLGYQMFFNGGFGGFGGNDTSDRSAARQNLTTSVNADNATKQPNATQAKPEEKKPTGPPTTMKFEEMDWDFGTIKDGEKVNHTFKFKNTGKNPLVISNAKGSCGCTVPQYPKEPIPPGGTGEIEVQYNSAGKGSPDGKKESKTVTITANTEPNQNTILKISANVIKEGGAATTATPTVTPTVIPSGK